MTAEEEDEVRAYMAAEDRRNALGECAAIDPDLDAALGAYMAALDDPLAKADAALVRLREVYSKYDYQWDEYVKDPHLFRRIGSSGSGVKAKQGDPERLWSAGR